MPNLPQTGYPRDASLREANRRLKALGAAHYRLLPIFVFNIFGSTSYVVIMTHAGLFRFSWVLLAISAMYGIVPYCFVLRQVGRGLGWSPARPLAIAALLAINGPFWVWVSHGSPWGLGGLAVTLGSVLWLVAAPVAPALRANGFACRAFRFTPSIYEFKEFLRSREAAGCLPPVPENMMTGEGPSFSA